MTAEEPIGESLSRQEFISNIEEAKKATQGQNIDYMSRVFQEQRGLQEKGRLALRLPVPNEASLYQFFPYLKDTHGAILGVAPENALDLFANSPASHLFIVDHCLNVTLMHRALLEVGLWHKKTFPAAPRPKELLAYFDIGGQLLESALQPNFTKEEITLVSLNLERNVWLRPVSLVDYLKFREKITDNQGRTFSWHADDAWLAKTITAYEEGRIIIITGDITDPQTMTKVAKVAERKGVEFEAIYWSNIGEGALKGENQKTRSKLLTSIQALPLTSNALILRTAHASSLSETPVPDSIQQDRQSGRLFIPWHYNIQEASDWIAKAAADPQYLSGAGWRLEAARREKSGQFPKNGFSYLPRRK